MNLYDILDVNIDANSNVIKQAYYKLAKKYHPDKHNNDPEMTKLFININTAYDILSDQDKRRQYDKSHNNSDLISLFMKMWTSYQDGIILYSPLNEMPYIHHININLFERYSSNCITVIIDNISYDVPTFKKQHFINDNNLLIIHHIPNNKYTITNSHDLFIVKSVNLHDYIYGGILNIEMPDDSTLIFPYTSCLEKKPLFTVSNYGLYKNETEADRGDLMIYITIEGVNDILDDELDYEYRNQVKQYLQTIYT